MATITIKFKDGFDLSNNVDISINFGCDGIYYQRIQVSNDLLRYQDISGDWFTCCNEIGWTNYKYKIITLDSNQTNFDSFITAMKDNIEGVLLESGTYKWVDELDVTVPNVFYLDYSSNNVSYTRIIVDRNTGVEYSNDDTINNYVYLKSSGWEDNIYKTITTTEDQYIDYDFYNYAILGNQLVKQGDTPTGTNKLKFGAETPSKLYIGESEVTKAYLGDVLIYEKGTSSGETWLLNESLEMASLSKTSVTFTSNNENFVSIAYSTSSMGPQTLWYYKNDSEYVVACEYGTYSNQAYRTITFKQPPTGDLLTWLQANGVKQ